MKKFTNLVIVLIAVTWVTHFLLHMKRPLAAKPSDDMLFVPTPPLGWRVGDTVMWRTASRTRRILITKGNCDTTLINVQDSPYVTAPDQYISFTQKDTTK